MFFSVDFPGVDMKAVAFSWNAKPPTIPFRKALPVSDDVTNVSVPAAMVLCAKLPDGDVVVQSASLNFSSPSSPTPLTHAYAVVPAAEAHDAAKALKTSAQSSERPMSALRPIISFDSP